MPLPKPALDPELSASAWIYFHSLDHDIADSAYPITRTDFEALKKQLEQLGEADELEILQSFVDEHDIEPADLRSSQMRTLENTLLYYDVLWVQSEY